MTDVSEKHVASISRVEEYAREEAGSKVALLALYFRRYI
jgi:hypothetical protein